MHLTYLEYGCGDISNSILPKLRIFLDRNNFESSYGKFPFFNQSERLKHLVYYLIH